LRYKKLYIQIEPSKNGALPQFKTLPREQYRFAMGQANIFQYVLATLMGKQPLRRTQIWIESTLPNTAARKFSILPRQSYDYYSERLSYRLGKAEYRHLVYFFTALALSISLLLFGAIIAYPHLRSSVSTYAVVGLFGLYVAAIFLTHFYKFLNERQEAALQRDTPCFHGVLGAAYGKSLCRECEVIEKADLAKAEQIKIELAARDKAANQQRYAEWLNSIRQAQYLTTMDPYQFEHLVAKLFSRLGYDAVVTKASGDGGIDINMTQGGTLTIVQCKRVKAYVSRPVLQQLSGVMAHVGASYGIVVTTGKVSPESKEWCADKPIRIIELDELSDMIRAEFHEDEVVPVDFKPTVTRPTICPNCASALRVVKYKNRKFLGCSGFPTCKYTTSLPAS
jgi:hypothetical protein